MKYLSHIATTVSCFGGFLFGYDLGVISGMSLSFYKMHTNQLYASAHDL